MESTTQTKQGASTSPAEYQPTSNNEISIPVGRAIEALRILERLASAPFPARAAYRIARLVARLQMNPDVVAAEKSRQAAVRKFGLERDGQITVPPAWLQDFADEYGPIAATVVSLPILPLPLSTLDAGPDISPADMMTLQDFLQED